MKRCNSSGYDRLEPMRLLIALTLILQCLAPPAASAEELGRLFLTPQQRQDLDRRRATNRAEEESPQTKEGPLTVNGHIQRSGGKTTTWINGTPEYDSHSTRNPAQVTVTPNEGEPGVRIKIGQTLDRSTGEVLDNIENGEIRIGKPPATGMGRSGR